MSSDDANFLLDSVPRWSWPGDVSSSPGPELNVSFYVSRSRGLKFVQTDARGEGFVKDVFRLMASPCATEAAPATIIDIGANTGYYSMLAAVFGCPVIAFEPQPGCWPSFEAAQVRNALAKSKVRYIPKPVSSRAAVIEVPSRGCAVTNQAKTEVSMEEVLRGSSARVRLVKIDTEGAEVNVLRSLLPVLSQLENLVVETSVGWWLRRYNVSRHEGAELYASLLEQHGFALARVSTGKLIEGGAQMRTYIHAFPSDGYWGQVDMWFARDGALLRRASPLMRARKSFFNFL